jgi:hypothetical protein
MVDQQNTFDTWRTSGPSFPWRQLILGALAPITIFYTLHRLDQPLTGALLAIGWSIGLLAIKYWRSRNIELFPALAIPIVLIELIGTLITAWTLQNAASVSYMVPKVQRNCRGLCV